MEKPTTEAWQVDFDAATQYAAAELDHPPQDPDHS